MMNNVKIVTNGIFKHIVVDAPKDCTLHRWDHDPLNQTVTVTFKVKWWGLPKHFLRMVRDICKGGFYIQQVINVTDETPQPPKASVEPHVH